MERIKQILEEKLNTDLLQIVLSDPRKKPETFGNAQGMEKDKALLASKVKIRPVQKKDRLFFQMTSYVGTQVFHTNYEKEELIAEIMLLLADFRQFSLQAADCQVTAMISKNGKATVKSGLQRNRKEPETVYQMNESLLWETVGHVIKTDYPTTVKELHSAGRCLCSVSAGAWCTECGWQYRAYEI